MTFNFLPGDQYCEYIGGKNPEYREWNRISNGDWKFEKYHIVNDQTILAALAAPSKKVTNCVIRDDKILDIVWADVVL